MKSNTPPRILRDPQRLASAPIRRHEYSTSLDIHSNPKLHNQGDQQVLKRMEEGDHDPKRLQTGTRHKPNKMGDAWQQHDRRHQTLLCETPDKNKASEDQRAGPHHRLRRRVDPAGQREDGNRHAIEAGEPAV
jgi:hypothetical protein